LKNKYVNRTMKKFVVYDTMIIIYYLDMCIYLCEIQIDF